MYNYSLAIPRLCKAMHRVILKLCRVNTKVMGSIAIAINRLCTYIYLSYT
jgi:hypothetical protein